eukprot:Nitzschia sp. Nitz4//scaffold63_size106090//20329//21846//NITZ4_004381-RA/size106090-processed-gene-0.119-mRNA-1//1//CDS//3329555948//4584//frame0
MASLAVWMMTHQPSSAWKLPLGLSRPLVRRCLASSSEPPTMDPPSRLSRQGMSMDLRTISSHTDMVLSHLKSRRASDQALEAAETIASLQSQRVSLIGQRDDFLHQRKSASALIGKLMRDKADASEVEKQKEISQQAAEKAQAVEATLEEIQSTMDKLLAGLPNLLDDCVPDGDDDTQNELVSSWGDITELPRRLGWTEDMEPKWHDEIAEGLNGYQIKAGVQMSGSRFAALSGGVAQLERALGMYFMEMHTQQHGYTEVSVPFIVSRSALEGTSQLPKFQEDLFAIDTKSHTCNGEDAFLIPTAEVPVTNMHANSILDHTELPISYVAWTPSFRSEAGSSGRDTRGLFRLHQFYKVELVKITTPEDSDAQHELLTSHAEACLQALELPYRKVRLCSGDIGFAAKHCYDLEVWLPGPSQFREISSCSNTGDFQARRMALRYRPDAPQKKKVKPELCHTINGSGLAVGRTLVAILENYQCPNGDVVIPTVLRPYMGGKEILESIKA